MRDIINGLCKGDNGKLDMKLDGDLFARNASTGVISVMGWEERYAYGVEWYTDGGRSDCLRIGNMGLHKTLPIQKGMRGCLLDDNGNVVKYLDTHGWEHEVRDGSQGQVMVEIPKHYRKVVSQYNTRQVWLSEIPLEGYEEVPLMYVGAYEAAYHPLAMQLFSVVNKSADYRGGMDGSAQWDSDTYTTLGMPKTALTTQYMRTCARNRNNARTNEWNILTYDAWKALYWLFVVEYAERNVQAGFNAALNANGYRQGGLGTGVTGLELDEWIDFNDTNPLVPCGVTDESGNMSASMPYKVLLRRAGDEVGGREVTFYVPRYRGVENPFGHLWKAIDGLFFANDNGVVKAYACSDPDYFASEPTSAYRYICNLPQTGQDHMFITQIAFGVYADIVPITVGGSSTQHFCDSYANRVTVGTMAATQGGDAIMSGEAGWLCTDQQAYEASYATTTTRLCFIPNKD